jgi:hypothetical protein
MQLNVSGGRNFARGIRIMAGVVNVLNYTDPENMPGMPGYNWYLTLSLDFGKLKSK